MRQITIVLLAAVVGGGCTSRVEPAQPGSEHFVAGHYRATDADIARGGENAPLEMRKAVGAYYMERGKPTAVMPPWIYAIKRVGQYELLYAGGPSKHDPSDFVYDPRTGRVVGTFDGWMPGGEEQSPPTAPAHNGTRL